MSGYYPVMLDVAGRIGIVVGHSPLALSKAEDLARAGARVTLYAPEPVDPVPSIPTVPRLPTAMEVAEAFVVVAVTDAPALIAWLKERIGPHQLLNVMDRPQECNFIFSSVLRRGPLTVAVSSNGTNPAMARLVREHLEDVLAPQWSDYMQMATMARQRLRDRGVGGSQRMAFFNELMASDALTLLESGASQEASHLVETLLDRYGAGTGEVPDVVSAGHR